ncbi:sulfatase-like hydrolase/transferase [Rubripirellula reticaptiva]|uniref:Arylsulfatase n=1 Tax=Rubripirellula reticaptiva TaxID=2528013 RepID=A0A5C6ERG0_9BACT|nr:sulfatase-like hydrolase/transferase [Rubripirellula reticaptiva]TWU51622.1 Arylsulfatase [Rubripirellula reticaptiva]
MKTKTASIASALLIGLIASLPCLTAVARTPATTDKPNIVLIFCDDLGYADVGFNADLFGVKTDVVTPNIDALARGGTICKQAYVTHPFCGPSRMGLLSGRMQHCFGGQKNLPDVAKHLEDYNSKGIPESETMISTVLQDAGYATSCVGKWHLGSSKPFHPNTRGFDQFFGFVGGGHQYFPSVTDNVEPKINDYQYFLERNGKDYLSPEGAYLTDMFSDEAVRIVSTNADAKKPFFLYLAYNAPHSPLQAKTEDLKFLYPEHQPKNPGNGVDYRDYETRQNYVAMMYAVDRGVGQIVSALEDPNGDSDKTDSIMDNTLIVFLSDNGGKIAQGASNAPLQDDKGSTHEGGIRVPMFMHWPAKVPAASVFDYPVLALDLYPTLAQLAGATVPSDKILDGKDIWQNFLAGKDSHENETMYWLRHHGGGNEVSLRRGNLKAYRKNFAVWKVFDMSTDIGELDNVASSHKAVLSSMIDDGLEWSKTHRDPQWHDTENGLNSWIENKMPRYDETFKMR